MAWGTASLCVGVGASDRGPQARMMRGGEGPLAIDRGRLRLGWVSASDMALELSSS